MTAQLDLGSLAEWAGAGTNTAVAMIAVGVVFLQRSIEERRERRRIASIGVSGAATALEGLNLIRQLEEEIGERRGPADDRIAWRIRLDVASGAIGVSITREHQDHVLIASLIEAKAWVELVSARLEDHGWIWARLSGYEADRTILEDRLKSMLRQFLGRLA